MLAQKPQVALRPAQLRRAVLQESGFGTAMERAVPFPLPAAARPAAKDTPSHYT